MITGGGLYQDQAIDMNSNFEAVNLDYLMDGNMYAPPCRAIPTFPYGMWGAVSTMAYVSTYRIYWNRSRPCIILNPKFPRLVLRHFKMYTI